MVRRLLDSPWFYYSLAAVLAVLAIASQFEVKLPSRPVEDVSELATLREQDDINVVFLLIDTLRADRMGAYGYSRKTTPTISELASWGIRFDHVQAHSSWTKTSMASLWTGLLPRHIGVLRYPHAVSDEATMPAEIFQQAGYKTAGIFRNGWVAPNFGFAQGFDQYFRPKPSATPDRFERRSPSTHPLQGSDFDATDSAQEFVRAHAHEPFFLYVHYMDVHQYLYDIESAHFGTTLSDTYDNAIHWTDRNVSSLVATLDDHDLLTKTMIVIASDHGEAFYEHGIEGHAQNLYREVTETPLIVIPPFRLDPGIVVEHKVQNIDIWPTVFDILGLDGMPDTDGRSLLPLILAAGGQGAALPGLEDRMSTAELDQTWGRVSAEPKPIVAMVDGPFRMVHHAVAPDDPELYDRRTDATENVNVAGDHPELVARLRARAEAYLAAPPRFEAPEVELDAMRRAQLRALGYELEEPEPEEEP
ncbi:MAG: sulfatase-like hydrolase/transferase [Proteobacteria bacterium]|nr:sulfatase-like hydrolase/transferase [Pseudomonadota bacterium]